MVEEGGGGGGGGGEGEGEGTGAGLLLTRRIGGAEFAINNP